MSVDNSRDKSSQKMLASISVAASTLGVPLPTYMLFYHKKSWLILANFRIIPELLLQLILWVQFRENLRADHVNEILEPGI